LVALALAVEVSPLRSALGNCSVRGRIHLDRIHEGEVDHEGAVGYGLARHAMAASTHGNWDLVFTGDADYLHDVGNAGGPHDCCRFAIDHAIPYAASLVVILVIRGEDRAVQHVTQAGELLG